MWDYWVRVFQPSHLCAGSFARVYRGSLEGVPVAVKIARDVRDSGRLDGTPREAAIMTLLEHPHIVRQITHGLAHSARGRPSYSEQAQQPEERLWMVLEFCDRGALEVGVFGKTLCSHQPCLATCIQALPWLYRPHASSCTCKARNGT